MLAAPLAIAAEREVVLYEPRHRVADELVPLAETVLGHSGSATLDDGEQKGKDVRPEE